MTVIVFIFYIQLIFKCCSQCYCSQCYPDCSHCQVWTCDPCYCDSCSSASYEPAINGICVTNVPTLVTQSTNPSARPISNPPASSSVRPTEYASLRPTIYPSISPSSLPTSPSTFNPSTRPTTYPSRSPSSNPSTNPIVIPTKIPTVYPTNNPSNIHSTSPFHPKTAHRNHNHVSTYEITTICLSILVSILLCCFVLMYYKKYKHKKNELITDSNHYVQLMDEKHINGHKNETQQFHQQEGSVDIGNNNKSMILSDTSNNGESIAISNFNESQQNENVNDNFPAFPIEKNTAGDFKEILSDNVLCTDIIMNDIVEDMDTDK